MNDVKTKQYRVWLYDGFDDEWMPVSPLLSLKEATKIWNEKTQNGTQNIHYDNIDYYTIEEAP